MKIRHVELSKAARMTMMEALKNANQTPEILAKEATVQKPRWQRVCQPYDWGRVPRP